MIPVKSDLIHLTGGGNSCQGGRPENQDDWGFLDTPLGFLLVVCDGMGGGPGGKTASEVAKKAFAQCIHSSNEHATPEETLKMAVAKAQEAIEQRASQDPSLTGMGSTLVALLVNKDQAWIAHLGDSRCYQMRGRRMVFRTKDHSLVGELVQYKTLTEEQARTSPQSNVITRALGSTANHVAEIESVPYCKGDRFVLCTDGVWGIMPQEQLLSRFAATPDAGVMADNLSKEIDNIGFATDGHHDNHTLAVVDMGENSNIQGKMTKTAKIIIAVLAGLLSVSLLFNVMALLSNLKKPLAEDNSYNYESDLELVLNENDSLQELISKKDSEIADLMAKSAKVAVAAKPDPKPVPEAEKKAENDIQSVQDNSPYGLAMQAIGELEKMKTIKRSTQPLASKEKAVHRNKAVSLLEQIDEATNKTHHNDIVTITNNLKDKRSKDGKKVTEAECMHVDKKDGEYVSMEKSNAKIEELIVKTKELANKLKQ